MARQLLLNLLYGRQSNTFIFLPTYLPRCLPPSQKKVKLTRHHLDHPIVQNFSFFSFSFLFFRRIAHHREFLCQIFSRFVKFAVFFV